jgi:hypothetical protein
MEAQPTLASVRERRREAEPGGARGLTAHGPRTRRHGRRGLGDRGLPLWRPRAGLGALPGAGPIRPPVGLHQGGLIWLRSARTAHNKRGLLVLAGLSIRLPHRCASPGMTGASTRGWDNATGHTAGRHPRRLWPASSGMRNRQRVPTRTPHGRAGASKGAARRACPPQDGAAPIDSRPMYYNIRVLDGHNWVGGRIENGGLFVTSPTLCRA